MNKLTPFEEACQILGISTALPIVTDLPQEDQAAIIAHYKLTKVIAAKNKLNNNWKPNWADRNQLKYFPWLWVNQAEGNTGFGLSYYDDDCTHTGTLIGSRLCLGSAEDCKTVFEECKDLYEAYFLFQN